MKAQQKPSSSPKPTPNDPNQTQGNNPLAADDDTPMRDNRQDRKGEKPPAQAIADLADKDTGAASVMNKPHWHLLMQHQWLRCKLRLLPPWG